MKARRDSDRKPLAGLTLIELLVVIAVIGTLFAVFMPALLDRPVKVPRIKCAYHLKQIGLALRIFANDHHEEEYDLLSSRQQAFRIHAG